MRSVVRSSITSAAAAANRLVSPNAAIPGPQLAGRFIEEAQITAQLGSYNYDTKKVAVDSEVKVVASDGYRMNTRGVSVDLDKKTMVGSGGVEGATSAGTFSADSMHADLNARTVDLQGRARLHMIPGKMQVPQRPGVGVELDLDRLARAHETYRRCGMRDRDDANTMRLVEPGWQRELF